MQVPRAAATVMLLREGERGCGFEVYMARRSARSRFSPEMYVFPGGAVDAADGSQQAFARLNGRPATVGAEFAVAALRELFEEAGVLIACDPDGHQAGFAEPEKLTALRAEVAQGAALLELLAREDLFLDARELHHYSNWVTPSSEPLRFDTHFFVARAPNDQVAAADAFELHDGRWIDPKDALASADRGEFALMFPTRKHIERLAAFDRLEAMLAHASSRRIVSVEPFRSADGGIEIPAEAVEW